MRAVEGVTPCLVTPASTFAGRRPGAAVKRIETGVGSVNFRGKGLWGIVVLIIAVVVVVAWWSDFFRVRGDTAPAGPGAGISDAATLQAKASANKAPETNVPAK